MKQLFLLTVLSLALISCTGNKKQADANVTTFELDEFLVVADRHVDQTVTVIGYVTHTCKHSGRKCFIVGESQKIDLQVMAGGEIESFSAELVGSKLAITGILKEHHIESESIDEMETKAKLKQQEGASEEACATELNNVSNMRKWMQEHNKDYYVIYYMEGVRFVVME